ncbi:AAA domain-containing protein [Azospira sp. I09]|uniref:AAA domain-containing protein n=1 Tax=Azospira sp. I09 TaxID=1765049 RepID=UPI0012611C6B|nr:AAA domain-containing protein [Azospira sp. I09]BBN90132.1 hypothetical protein AZSP09_31550 [Azospira sp. I09]
MNSTARRRRKDGFLATYIVDEDYLQKPDVATGRPGIVGGKDPDGNSVLIREWRRSPKASDSELEQIWRHELRQLHRLAGYPGSASCISRLHDAGFDTRGFYLIIAPGQRQPLEFLLRNGPSSHWLRQPRSTASRLRVWANLKLLAHGLETLHAQGMLHRSIDAWSVLTAGGSEPDFQLTGFEWTMRIASVEGVSNRGAAAGAARTFDSFSQDWKDFGLLAADLLGAKRQRVLDPAIAPFEIAEYLTLEEARLLRLIVQMNPRQPLDGDAVVTRIDGVLGALRAEAANRRAKLHLAIRIGPTSRLGERIRNASGLDIEMDDLQAQLQFVKDDLASEPLLLCVRQPDASNEFRLVLRGKHLLYRLQEFRAPKTMALSWDFAYCEAVDANAPAPVNLLDQRRLQPESLEILGLRDASDLFPRVRGKLMSWDEMRSDFGQINAPLSSEQTAHRALTLLQLLEAVYAAADAYAVELQPLPEHLRETAEHGNDRLCVQLRLDPERMALSDSLDLKSPTDRFIKRLEADGLGSEGWILADARSLGERESTDTEWTFRQVIQRPGQPDVFLFDGPDAIPFLYEPIMVPASVGRDVQFRRRLKALKALKTHHELLQMIVDPRHHVLDSHDTVIEDAAFMKLDEPKQLALKQLTSTLPLFLVQGPPGVGKTRLVRDLVARRFADEPTSRLLLTAQSNAAIDHLMDELAGVLKANDSSGPLVVRSSKRDAIEAPSQFDIGEQTRRLVRRLAASPLAKEVPTRLQRSLSDLAKAADPSQSAGRRTAAVAGRSAEQALRTFEGVVARAANVVFATTNSGELERLIDERGQFDWAIVEEAAKATGSELVSPLLLSHRRLMIGDHKQLPAFASDQLKQLLAQPDRIHEAMKLGEEFIGRSLRDAATEELLEDVAEDKSQLPVLCSEALRLLTFFESAIEAEFKRQAKGRGGRPIAQKLTAQHRMHPAIAELVSNCFYGNLKTDPTCEKRFAVEPRPFTSADENRLPLAPIVVIDMPYVQSTPNQKQGDQYPAWHNPAEVRAAIEALGLLRSAPQDATEAPTLAILSPYGRQRRALNEAISDELNRKLSHLKMFRSPSFNGQWCHTVDSFQGSEADVVVVSLVRNNHHSSVQSALGFLSDARRMNVLLSRAKWQLVLIASTEFLKEVMHAVRGTPDESRMEFLRNLLDGLDSGQAKGDVKRVPFQTLLESCK